MVIWVVSELALSVKTRKEQPSKDTWNTDRQGQELLKLSVHTDQLGVILTGKL